MKKDAVWLVVAIVLLVGVIGGLVWIFGGFNGDSGSVPETTESSEVSDTENQEEESSEEDQSEEDNTTDQEEEEEENLEDISVDDTVTYSTGSQSVGEDTEEIFVLDSVDVSKGEEVMEIEYVFTADDISEDSSIPVSAENKSSLGAMEIVVSNVQSDNTGMNYDESIGVNKEGITNLTKVVSGSSNTLKYNLGFVDAPEYYLYEPEMAGDTLVVKFSIKYPGGSISEEEYGVEEFTSEDVTVESSTTDNGVRISGYTYSASGGILRYVFKTSSNSGSPIPSFEGSIESGTLTVIFPSLSADIIYSSSEGTVSLPAGVTLNVARSGSQSTYDFVGVGEEYRLYATESPNQVILEVKL